MQEADAALHRVKGSEERRLQLYEPKLAAEAVEQIDLEHDLRRAVERGEFSLRYQPKVALADLRVLSFEALLRWEHPSRGVLRPGAFLELAEDLGLTLPIGRWVLGEACRQASEWISQHEGLENPVVCVNLSARQLHDSRIVDDVRLAIEAAGLEAQALCIEITETVAMAVSSPAPEILTGLRELGVSLAMDDFGVGYSSLARLRSLPLETLKIDQSFVAEVTAASEAADIIKAIISLGRALDMLVIAEGVETEAQLECLRELECDAGQGNYFAPPLPAEQASRVIARGGSWVDLAPGMPGATVS
jgi:EAL domain-containing protein (putative c-di-GMP-specific phosphodiesterase class I)